MWLMFIRGVAGFTAVFVHQQFDQFPFSGQLILFAHDLQEGDGVGEVEVAEVEAWAAISSETPICVKNFSQFPLWMASPSSYQISTRVKMAQNL